jgi:5-formyltetrahydrofolate cyclo-ligase
MCAKGKDLIRHKIWSLLEKNNLVDFPRPCYGRIPNFKKAREAAERICTLTEFSISECVFCAPDAVLQRVRELVLEQGKTLAVALPHMEAFLEINQRSNISRATRISGMRKYGSPLHTRVDLFVQGSVAVDLYGSRLGKGRGYGDTEYLLLKKRGLLSKNAKVVTIVHRLQITPDLRSFMSERDVEVDYVITPEGILQTSALDGFQT